VRTGFDFTELDRSNSRPRTEIVVTSQPEVLVLERSNVTGLDHCDECHGVVDLELSHQLGIANAESVGPQVLGFLLPIVSFEDLMNALLGHLEGVPDDLVGETLLTEFGDLLD
jgi:hypothetical protein